MIADSENIAQAECPEGIAEALSHLCRLDRLILSEMTCGLSYQIGLTVGYDAPGGPRNGLRSLRLSLTDVIYQVLGRPRTAAEPMPGGNEAG